MKVNTNEDMKWDNRELGCDERYVKAVSAEKMSEIYKALGLVEVKFKLHEDLHQKLLTKASTEGLIMSAYLRKLIEEA